MHKKKKNNENENATDKDSATHLLANSASFPNATSIPDRQALIILQQLAIIIRLGPHLSHISPGMR